MSVLFFAVSLYNKDPVLGVGTKNFVYSTDFTFLIICYI